MTNKLVRVNSVLKKISLRLWPYFVAFLILISLSYYLTLMPGQSYMGKITPTAQELASVPALRQHVKQIAFAEHNSVAYRNLEISRDYIINTLKNMGLKPNLVSYKDKGITFSNIEVIFQARDSANNKSSVVIGAHYDSAEGSIGANDNASGSAVLLELAKRIQARSVDGTKPVQELRLVWFVNEEPNYFKTELMGSFVYAKNLLATGVSVSSMYSLEMLGAFYDTPNTQHYPLLFSLFYPSEGNFVAFVGNMKSKKLVQDSLLAFRQSAVKIGSQGIAAPQFIQGIDYSDHWSFYQLGINAIMITDTAYNRYEHYHKYSDTADKLNYEAMSVVLSGLDKMYYNLYY